MKSITNPFLFGALALALCLALSPLSLRADTTTTTSVSTSSSTTIVVPAISTSNSSNADLNAAVANANQSMSNSSSSSSSSSNNNSVQLPDPTAALPYITAEAGNQLNYKIDGVARLVQKLKNIDTYSQYYSATEYNKRKNLIKAQILNLLIKEVTSSTMADSDKQSLIGSADASSMVYGGLRKDLATLYSDTTYTGKVYSDFDLASRIRTVFSTFNSSSPSAEMTSLLGQSDLLAALNSSTRMNSGN